jgi:hypothetical protein
MTPLHHVRHLDGDVHGPALGGQSNAIAIRDTELRGIGRIDAQCPLRILLSPPGVSQDRIGRERTAFAGGQDEGECVVRSAGGCFSQAPELVQELGDRRLDPSARGLQSLPTLLVSIDGENHPRGVLQDRIE